MSIFLLQSATWFKHRESQIHPAPCPGEASSHQAVAFGAKITSNSWGGGGSSSAMRVGMGGIRCGFFGGKLLLVEGFQSFKGGLVLVRSSNSTEFIALCVKFLCLKKVRVALNFEASSPVEHLFFWGTKFRPQKVAIERAQRAGVMFIAAAGNEAGGLMPLVVGLWCCLGGDLGESSQND